MKFKRRNILFVDISKKFLVEGKSSRNLPPLTRAEGRPTPILLEGVQRLCEVKTAGLYGNAFARASENAVKKATRIIRPPTITNFLCMAALGGGHGEYSLGQIVDLFVNAYTSFRAAKELAKEKGGKVLIHTGNWGTGAFGGNKPLMAIIQLSAAWMAGVDGLVYHTFDRLGTQGYKQGKKILENEILKDVGEEGLKTSDFLKKLQDLQFRWGVSDGN
eukprot:TRINITY_DN20385_c0_g1_i1.p1 TRINITY_DN20385_c0_g1~~TRINITY_DN20385_c0_g1_i1.p1  ORF type:complete len:218 (-),score=55.34 TRINITY_DN20385_c0_g1_i1:2-655(-)